MVFGYIRKLGSDRPRADLDIHVKYGGKAWAGTTTARVIGLEKLYIICREHVEIQDKSV